MMDEERQGQILRERLDHELASVRVTAEARQRLSHARARFADRRSTGARIVVPVAATVAVVALIAVPPILRSTTGSESGVPAATVAASPEPPGSSTPGPTPSSPPAPTSRRPAPQASREAAEERAERLRLEQAAATLTGSIEVRVSAGERVVLVVNSPVGFTGDLIAQWQDGTEPQPVETDCSGLPTRGPVRPSSQPRLESTRLTHTYQRSGTYLVTVTLESCIAATSTDTTLRVQRER